MTKIFIEAHLLMKELLNNFEFLLLFLVSLLVKSGSIDQRNDFFNLDILELCVFPPALRAVPDLPAFNLSVAFIFLKDFSGGFEALKDSFLDGFFRVIFELDEVLVTELVFSKLNDS